MHGPTIEFSVANITIEHNGRRYTFPSGTLRVGDSLPAPRAPGTDVMALTASVYDSAPALAATPIPGDVAGKVPCGRGQHDAQA